MYILLDENVYTFLMELLRRLNRIIKGFQSLFDLYAYLLLPDLALFVSFTSITKSYITELYYNLFNSF
jgi:hypothetical protein